VKTFKAQFRVSGTTAGKSDVNAAEIGDAKSTKTLATE